MVAIGSAQCCAAISLSVQSDESLLNGSSNRQSGWSTLPRYDPRLGCTQVSIFNPSSASSGHSYQPMFCKLGERVSGFWTRFQSLMKVRFDELGPDCCFKFGGVDFGIKGAFDLVVIRERGTTRAISSGLRSSRDSFLVGVKSTCSAHHKKALPKGVRKTRGRAGRFKRARLGFGGKGESGGVWRQLAPRRCF